MTNEEEFSAKEVVEVLNRFDYHPPNALSVKAHETIRRSYKAMAVTVMDMTRPGRHRNLALTALQQAAMWSNASIAVEGLPEGFDPTVEPWSGYFEEPDLFR